ncbi:MAG: ABC transporter permease subunit [Thermoplasmatota archaeon]
MPEGAHAYPRWHGRLSGAPRFPVIIAEEVRRAWLDQWARAALILIVGYSALYIGQLYTLSKSGGSGVHTMANFLQLYDLLRWGALGIAAVMAGPALLEDTRRGALDLYLSRSVTTTDYLVGKVGAVFGLATAAMWAPALVYWLLSFLLFDAQPAHWALVPLTSLAYAAMWGLLVTGLGLGLSAVMKSARAATLVLFAGFAGLDIIVSDLLAAITKNDAVKIVSPFQAMTALSDPIFQAPTSHPFPVWWGLVAWGGLVVVGWGLLAWKRPKLRGEE